MDISNAKVFEREYSIEIPGMEETDRGDSSGSSATSSMAGSVTSPPTPSKLKRNVSFGNLEELCFTVEKGDHEMAYPMALGVFVGESFHSVDDYEAEREGLRGKGDELRTAIEERKKIIKKCKKLAKEIGAKHGHRRRISIGNGEISRLAKMTEFLFSNNKKDTELPTAGATAGGAEAGRPGLRRQNSIGNGEISRLSKRSSVTKFLGSITKSKANDKQSSSPNRKSAVIAPEEIELEAAQAAGKIAFPIGTIQNATENDFAAGSPPLRRQNSIGNGEISRLAAKRNSSNGGTIRSILKKPSGNGSDSDSDRRGTWHGATEQESTPPLKRRDSIGNGEISRLAALANEIGMERVDTCDFSV